MNKTQMKLQAIREINASMIRAHDTMANRQATNHGGLTTFKSATGVVQMPVKEYEVLIKAQDSLKEMMRGIADGNAMKEAETLKLFQVLVTFPVNVAVNMAGDIKIEMTVLDTCEDDAVKEVKRILEYDGYGDLNLEETLIHISEIKGPFDKGFVIQRNGG